MSDRILIHRIAIFAHHGLHREEQRLGQRFYVSLDCRLDLSQAGRTDRLENTVCYGRLTEIAMEIGTRRRFLLIEALAEAIAAEALAAFPPLQAITVRVDKPSAPLPAIIEGVSVEITRARHA